MQQWKRAQEQKIAQVVKAKAQAQKAGKKKKIVLTRKPVYNSAFTSFAANRQQQQRRR